MSLPSLKMLIAGIMKLSIAAQVKKTIIGENNLMDLILTDHYINTLKSR